MNRVSFAGLIVAFSLGHQVAQAAEIKGAGSSAAQPLYTALAAAYGKTAPLTLTYMATGSSDGLKQVKEKTVDFGASDIALSAEERKASKLLCFPAAITGVVAVVNLPGIRAQLQLTGEILADIFARKIVKWNDARIKAVNPALALPDLAIAVIVRSDGSGSTFNFTDYLSKSSPAWAASAGRNYTVAWAAGTVAAKGSAGVVTAFKQTPGAIAYVDFQYAVHGNLSMAALKNRDGKFVAPGNQSFSAALANSAWMSRASYEEMLTNQPGAGSWPITTGTFVLLPQLSSTPEKTIAVLKMFSWGFVHGDSAVGQAEFVRLPDVVQGRIFGEFSAITDAAGVPLKWSLTDVLKLR